MQNNSLVACFQTYLFIFAPSSNALLLFHFPSPNSTPVSLSHASYDPLPSPTLPLAFISSHSAILSPPPPHPHPSDNMVFLILPWFLFWFLHIHKTHKHMRTYTHTDAGTHTHMQMHIHTSTDTQVHTGEHAFTDNKWTFKSCLHMRKKYGIFFFFLISLDILLSNPTHFHTDFIILFLFMVQ